MRIFYKPVEGVSRESYKKLIFYTFKDLTKLKEAISSTRLIELLFNFKLTKREILFSLTNNHKIYLLHYLQNNYLLFHCLQIFLLQ